MGLCGVAGGRRGEGEKNLFWLVCGDEFLAFLLLDLGFFYFLCV